jgi:phosphotransferase system HPr-like phosphotransfer protein
MDELTTVEGTFIVEHPLGLHAVLAVKLATVAQGFRSDIGFRVGGQLADVKARRT